MRSAAQRRSRTCATRSRPPRPTASPCSARRATTGRRTTRKTPVGKGGSLIPGPTVEWPASDPLVTGVGGTYLCTDPLAGTNEPRTSYIVPGSRRRSAAATLQPGHNRPRSPGRSPAAASATCSRSPAYQNTLPAGSTAIGSMRGVPDVALQASAGTGALVYLSLPPDGNAARSSDQHRLVRHRRHVAQLPRSGPGSWRSRTRSTAAASG